MSSAEWIEDISMAKNAKIDGFAMNIAAGDPDTDRVLENAYAAAETQSDFKLFLSFDYLSTGAWQPDHVIRKVNQHKSSTAQFYYDGRPLVSTFEGIDNIDDWNDIKAATGCFFIPDWSSLAPTGFAKHLNLADGAFSWDAWPEGAHDKGVEADLAWMRMLDQKPFMMPVSPWFYTNLPQWDKNWLWRGDDLWHDRWKEVARLKPSMVQIISWNDFGEAHYIGPIRPEGVPQGAHYVDGMPHEAWLNFLPYYIAAYKLENNSWSKDAEESITFWYKKNPGQSGSTGGTMGNSQGHDQRLLPPHLVSQDKIFLSAIVTQPAEILVSIGNSRPTSLRALNTGINHFSVPLRDRLGPVHFRMVRDGKLVVSVNGPAVTKECKGGLVNWNAFVGSS